MRFEWQFDRGQFDPEAGVVPVKVRFSLAGPSGGSVIEAIVSENDARQMVNDLMGVTTGIEIPTGGGG